MQKNVILYLEGSSVTWIIPEFSDLKITWKFVDAKNKFAYLLKTPKNITGSAFRNREIIPWNWTVHFSTTDIPISFLNAVRLVQATNYESCIIKLKTTTVLLTLAVASLKPGTIGSRKQYRHNDYMFGW